MWALDQGAIGPVQEKLDLESAPVRRLFDRAYDDGDRQAIECWLRICAIARECDRE